MIGTVIAAGTVVLAVTVVCGLLFLIVYSSVFPWWKSREGRYIFTNSGVLTAVLTYVYASTMGWLGGPASTVSQLNAGRAWVRLVVFAAVFLLQVWVGALLLMAKIEAHQAQQAEVRDG